jgi:hypothetical protein
MSIPSYTPALTNPFPSIYIYIYLQLSLDKKSVFCHPRQAQGGIGACGCVYGDVGFSSGSHYWEFKIEGAVAGSVFLGVAEKHGQPGRADNSALRRKVGLGILSNRTAYRGATRESSERAFVYVSVYIYIYIYMCVCVCVCVCVYICTLQSH